MIKTSSEGKCLWWGSIRLAGSKLCWKGIKQRNRNNKQNSQLVIQSDLWHLENHVRGEAGCFLWLWRKTASKSEKTGQLSQKNNSSEGGEAGEGRHLRFHTTNIQQIFFWHFILCYFLSCRGWKSCLTFFFSFVLREFLGLWGKAQQPSVCLARKKKKKHLGIRQEPCVWAQLGFSLALVGRERLIELTVLAVCAHKCPLNPPPRQGQITLRAKVINTFHFLDLRELKPFVFVFFPCVFTLKSGFRS